MHKRERAQLLVYQTDEFVEKLPVSCLRKLFLEKTSEIIYITKDKKLYGIICLGDILNHSYNGYVQINRNFTVLKKCNIVKAHKIFQERRNINKIPIVNENDELIGDYSRWDDLLYINREHRQFIKKEVVEQIMKPYNKVYVIEAMHSEHLIYNKMLEFMNQFQINYKVLNKEQLQRGISEGSLCIFLDEEEKRGVQCLYGCEINRFDISLNTQYKVKFITYSALLRQIIQEQELKDLGIDRPTNVTCDRIDDKTTILFSALKEKGIKCFCLYINEKESTKFGKKFCHEVRERTKVHPVNIYEPWPKKQDNEEHFKKFLGDLYELEDYKKEIVQREVSDATHIFEYQKNICGRYFNAKDGRRITCFQPNEYVGTIYLLGPCTMIGFLFEDQYTPGSYLQKKLIEKGYYYRVENYGAIARIDSNIDIRLQEIGEYHANDIVIMLSRKGEAVGVPGVSLEKIFEKNQIPSEWVVDGYTHCNYKVNQIIADSIFEMIETCLYK